jgi:hypothetical protein
MENISDRVGVMVILQTSTREVLCSNLGGTLDILTEDFMVFLRPPWQMPWQYLC